MNQLTQSSKTYLGFWIYLMTDCVLFASLFAAYAVLHGNAAGREALGQLFNLQYVLVQTLILLASSYTVALGVLAAKRGKRGWFIGLIAATMVLGASFLVLEVLEFSKLIGEGNGPAASGALTSFFALVGTHGAHIAVGLIWMQALLRWAWRRPLDQLTLGRLTLLSLFWHFLDVIWIFIFSLVYLLGVALV